MMNPRTHGPSIAVHAATSSVHRAFAALDRADQRLLESVLFDGFTCVQIARSIGAAPSEIRWRVGAAMLELHAVQMRDGETDHSSVPVMLALRALDALDPDEAALVDVLLEHQPTMRWAYTAYCELVGLLSLMVPRVAPPSSLVTRLLGASGDDTATN